MNISGYVLVAKLLKDKIYGIIDQIIITNESYKICWPVILWYLVLALNVKSFS